MCGISYCTKLGYLIGIPFDNSEASHGGDFFCWHLKFAYITHTQDTDCLQPGSQDQLQLYNLNSFGFSFLLF